MECWERSTASSRVWWKGRYAFSEKRAKSYEHNEIYLLKRRRESEKESKKVRRSKTGGKGCHKAQLAQLFREERLWNVEYFENFPFASLLVADDFTKAQENVWTFLRCRDLSDNTARNLHLWRGEKLWCASASAYAPACWKLRIKKLRGESVYLLTNNGFMTHRAAPQSGAEIEFPQWKSSCPDGGWNIRDGFRLSSRLIWFEFSNIKHYPELGCVAS